MTLIFGIRPCLISKGSSSLRPSMKNRWIHFSNRETCWNSFLSSSLGWDHAKLKILHSYMSVFWLQNKWNSLALFIDLSRWRNKRLLYFWGTRRCPWKYSLIFWNPSSWNALVISDWSWNVDSLKITLFPPRIFISVIFLTIVIRNNSVQKNSVPKKRIRIESYVLNNNHAGNDFGSLRQ